MKNNKYSTIGLRKIALSNDGKLLATISEVQSILNIWKLEDLFNSNEYESIQIKHENSILAFSFSNDSESLVTCDFGEKVFIWLLKDTQYVKQIKTLSPFVLSYSRDRDEDEMRFYEEQLSFTSLAFNPQQESNLISASFFHSFREESFLNNIVIWNKYTGEIITRLLGHKGRTDSISFSSDGKKLVSYGGDQKLKIWNIEKPEKLLFDITEHYGEATVVCSPTEPIIASGGDDTIINIYDLEMGKKIQYLNEHLEPINSIIFSLDGKLLISSSSSNTTGIKKRTGEIKIWQQE